MKHSVIRIVDLQTQYLHRMPDGSFEWSLTQEGRYEFANQEIAGIEAAIHEGIAVPVDPIPEAARRSYSTHPPKPTAEEPPTRDWLSRWEMEHDL